MALFHLLLLFRLNYRGWHLLVAPLAVLLNIQFLRPITKGLIALSARLLSIGKSAVSIYLDSLSHWFRLYLIAAPIKLFGGTCCSDLSSHALNASSNCLDFSWPYLILLFLCFAFYFLLYSIQFFNMVNRPIGFAYFSFYLSSLSLNKFTTRMSHTADKGCFYVAVTGIAINDKVLVIVPKIICRATALIEYFDTRKVRYSLFYFPKVSPFPCNIPTCSSFVCRLL